MASRLQSKQSSVTKYEPNPAYGVVSHSQVHIESRCESDIVHDHDQQPSSVSYSAIPNNREQQPPFESQHDYTYAYPDPSAVPTMDLNMVPASAPPSYQVSAAASGASVGVPKPDYPSAHSFLALTTSVTITCGILNPLSLSFGIPALVLAVLTLKYKYKKEDYPKAKVYGRCAFTFTLITVIFTLGFAIVITASSLGAYSNCRSLQIFRNSDPRCF